MKNSFHQSGQALLIVVLVMVIALTVGLSVASRSVTNLRNSTQEAASQAAFSAAEAGVEQAVKLGNTSGVLLQNVLLNDKNNSQISSVSAQTIDGSEFLLNNGNPIFQDDGTDVWLSPHSDTASQLFASPWGNGSSETLNIQWGTHAITASCSDPALEILVISGVKTSPTLAKYVYDPCATRRTVNSFCAIGSSQAPCQTATVTSQSGSFPVNGANGSETFDYRVQVSVANGLLARIIPLYAAGSVGIVGSGLPVQGKIITSTGTAGSTDSETVRKISFFQGYDSVPSEFFYSLFTPK